MDNLSDILEKLRISLTGEDISNHDGKLPPDASLVRAVLEAIKEHKDNFPVSEIQKILPLLKPHFPGNDFNLMATLLELIAELCKSEDARQLCVDEGYIPCILNCIETQHPDVVLQTFRAIGNIACDNNKAREEILEAGGVKKILKRLKELQNKELKDCETRHHVTACGAVLNLSFDNEIIQRELIQGGAIPMLLQYVEDNMNNSTLSSMATNAVSCLIDIDEGLSSFITSRGCEIFVKALKLSSGDLTTSLAECLRALSEEDDAKQALVSENCVDVFQEIISTNTSSNNKQDVLEKLKTCVDLIILLLGDDNCLDKLFAEENNIFIDKILLWSQSSEEYVRNSCPVAIGNVARTETNCLQLVKMEVHHKLIGLLRKEAGNMVCLPTLLASH